MPPTQDAFELHAKQAIYQICIWKQAHKPHIEVPPATDYGRHIKENLLVCQLMTKTPKPNFAQACVFCKCAVSKCIQNCKCARILQLMISSELCDTNYNLVYRLCECKLNNGDVLINIL